MKLAISNIAWLPAERRDVYALMRDQGFTGLEVAPALALPDEADPFNPSVAGVAALGVECATFGLELVSMQSLLFGVSGAQLFGEPREQVALERGLDRAIGLAVKLNIPNLVFGSPRNRAYPETMPAAVALARATEFFRRMGDRAEAAGAVLAIEPNPAAYGTNFLTTVQAAADFVAAADRPGVMLNFDIGALLTDGGENRAAELYRRAGGRVSHVHISEPNLAPAPADTERVAAIAAALIDCGYRGWFSIEMRRPDGDALSVIEAHLDRVAKMRDQIEGR